MVSYLLDTNHASKPMAKEEAITSRVRAAQQRDAGFAISMTVLGELCYGVHLRQRREQNRRLLQDLIDTLLLLPFNEAAAEMFGRIQAEQRTRGKPVRPLDAQIAAVARTRDLIVLTADHHFQFIAGIAGENWLS